MSLPIAQIVTGGVYVGGKFARTRKVTRIQTFSDGIDVYWTAADTGTESKSRLAAFARWATRREEAPKAQV